jgi:hypothetical protein
VIAVIKSCGFAIALALFTGASMYGCSGDERETIPSYQDANKHDPLRQLILHQPDFTAVAIMSFAGEGPIKSLNGVSISLRVAKKGLTYRRDRDVVISYERPNEPMLLYYPRSREYMESPRIGIWFENAASPGLAALDSPNLVFERTGDLELDGHKCLKVQLSNKDDLSARVVYYVATDLRNLAIQIEVINAFGVKTYKLEDISFDVADDAFDPPRGYAKSTADPTAEYRLRDHFELGSVGELTPEFFQRAVLERLPPGTAEQEVYKYLDYQLRGDRLSSYNKADVRGKVVCRLEYDPTLPGLVKKHFAVVFFLDEQKKLKDVRLDSWITGL